MNLKKRHRGHVEVHTSALNDIMFFLLLFFLLASAVVNPNVVKLLLPRSSSGQSIPTKKINVSISEDLKYSVENKEVAFDQLFAVIESYQKASPDMTIILSADKSTTVQNLVDITDIANKLQVKLVLATESKK
ncbi:ExbD/TolR family protein [Hufsiella ginkgonis]|uniref:Biopolymer transporter ExbD n=1 Tax=Hufsiella ginkgonis TaxID=2695274 RepID=A0A7K1XZP3_9SPHI|nr:biopolymer transporter ExbD [Hufsiella ginkgonis]MXV16287.1 biopolymer transporter ExbD [Hufsiella ginkgonis]